MLSLRKMAQQTAKMSNLTHLVQYEAKPSPQGKFCYFNWLTHSGWIGSWRAILRLFWGKLIVFRGKNRLLTISREADYAVRIAVHLATSRQERFQAKDLARAESIPESFLFKILQWLIKRGVVRSFRGVRGGYQLAMDPGNLTLYRLLEMVEGPVCLNVCVSPGVGCDLRSRCAVHELWVTAQAQLRRTLQNATLADLARRTKQKRLQFVCRRNGTEKQCPATFQTKNPTEKS